MKIPNILKKTIVVIPLVAALLSLILQLYIFPDAGKKIENRRNFYTYTLDHWNNEVYKNFNIIRTSGTYARMHWSDDKKLEINDHYMRDVHEFCYQMQELSRTLEYQGRAVTSILSDMEPLITNLKSFMAKDERQKIANDINVRYPDFFGHSCLLK